MKARQIILVERPKGLPSESAFAFREVELGGLQEGQVLVALRFASVDPYMRGRMRDVKSYVPPYSLGEPIRGGAVGQVVESNAPGLRPDDWVVGPMAWSNYDQIEARSVARISPGSVRPSAYLGILGMTGLTAYVGMLTYGDPKPGETVFVSGAAGAVGSAAGQIAKLRGARVVGSAGGPEKVSRLYEMGFDEAFDYREGSALAALRRTAPAGVDVYFDNVGGDQLAAALEESNNFARFVLCGTISNYNSESAVPGPSNLFRIVQRRLRLQGFIVTDHVDQNAQFLSEMSKWIEAGKIQYDETVVHGLERLPEAFVGLFSGRNLGKMVVEL